MVGYISQQKLAPWIFLTPGLVLFLVIVILPIFQSFQLSFFEWDGMSRPIFIGWENYREIWEDESFFISLKNNFWWMTFYLLSLPLGLGLALFLNQELFAIRWVKSLFFFPFVISQVVVGLVFSWFYNPDFGLLNVVLEFIGLDPIAVLSNENLVTFGIILAGLWPQIAYCMILYLAGLTAIKPELVEAARLDKAKQWNMFYHVILPQLRPASFIALVVSMIGALRSFDLVLIMTAGGPFNSSSVLGYFMYEQAIFNYRMGYGASIAVVLFLIMFLFIAFFLKKMVQSDL